MNIKRTSVRRITKEFCEKSSLGPPSALSAAVLLQGCSPDPQYLTVVDARPSPAGVLKAVYVEDLQGGAAVGIGQDVYVIEGSHPLRYADRVFSDECVENVRVDWSEPRTLRISFDAGTENTSRTASALRLRARGIKLELARRVHPGNFC